MVKIQFDDCPYKCTDGKLLDYHTAKFVDCPHCAGKREELAKEGLAEDESGELDSLPRLLGIDSRYLSSRFVYDSVIPEGERVFIEDESIKRQSDVLTEIYLGLGVGELPDRSYCIGLGNKGRIDKLAYPLLVKAYLSGLSVAKFISCIEYNRLYVAMSDEVESYLEKDLVMMLIPDGASKADILSAKGLMQSRALKGKPTIFVTTWIIEACSILLGYYSDETHFLASGVFVEYKVGKKKRSNYINQLTGVENELFVEEEDEPKAGTNMINLADLLNQS